MDPLFTSVGQWSQQLTRGGGFVVGPHGAARDDGRVEPSRAEQTPQLIWGQQNYALIGGDTAPAAVGGNKGAGLALKAPLADPGPRLSNNNNSGGDGGGSACVDHHSSTLQTAHVLEVLTRR